jgi:uncharacterized membrane protein YeaQ/YmgE (transglycosylase-associated protein family)
MLAIIRMIVVGFIVGALGKLLILGNAHIGFVMTALLGIAGSVIAGLVVHLLSSSQRDKPFHPAGFLASIVGAAVLLWLAMKFGWFVK